MALQVAPAAASLPVKPAAEEDPTSYVRGLLSRARHAYVTENFSRALLLAEQANLTTPTAAGYVIQGKVYLYLRDFISARAAYKQALALNPTYPAAVKGLSLANRSP